MYTLRDRSMFLSYFLYEKKILLTVFRTAYDIMKSYNIKFSERKVLVSYLNTSFKALDSTLLEVEILNILLNLFDNLAL